jgi:hypothetical protein
MLSEIPSFLTFSKIALCIPIILAPKNLAGKYLEVAEVQTILQPVYSAAKKISKCEAEKMPKVLLNRPACIRHQCRKTTVLSCHRCLINTGVDKI